MMGVYIKDMEMPIIEMEWTIRHGADGKWYAIDTNAETTDGEWHEIISVPQHGRLGDLDRLAKEVKDMAKEFPLDSIGAERYKLFAKFIKAAPTIIPAEGE